MNFAQTAERYLRPRGTFFEQLCPLSEIYSTERSCAEFETGRRKRPRGINGRFSLTNGYLCDRFDPLEVFCGNPYAVVEVDETEAESGVETWSYDPAGLSDGRLVDPLSLYAQFRDYSDERVSMAAEKLLESLSW